MVDRDRLLLADDRGYRWAAAWRHHGKWTIAARRTHRPLLAAHRTHGRASPAGISRQVPPFLAARSAPGRLTPRGGASTCYPCSDSRRCACKLSFRRTLRTSWLGGASAGEPGGAVNARLTAR